MHVYASISPRKFLLLILENNSDFDAKEVEISSLVVVVVFPSVEVTILRHIHWLAAAAVVGRHDNTR